MPESKPMTASGSLNEDCGGARRSHMPSRCITAPVFTSASTVQNSLARLCEAAMTSAATAAARRRSMRVLSFGERSAFAEQAADDLGGVVHHRHDAGVIEACGADHSDDADDVLPSVAEGRRDHGRAGQRKQFVLR